MPQPLQSFDAMRQDAIRRSREMQRRAMHHPPPEPAPEPQQPTPPEQTEQPAQPENSSHRPEPLHLPEELQGLLTGWDTEKLALLALLYLLYKEGTEMRLLLAIAYILL